VSRAAYCDTIYNMLDVIIPTTTVTRLVTELWCLAASSVLPQPKTVIGPVQCAMILTKLDTWSLQGVLARSIRKPCHKQFLGPYELVQVRTSGKVKMYP